MQMNLCRYGLLALVCFAVWTVCTTCCADWIFLGPTPYLSAADSPFPVDGSNPNFFLEDFEDPPTDIPPDFSGGGAIDSPGIHVIYGSTGHGLSVDADDGVIDGSGADGVSATAVGVGFSSLGSLYSFDIQFDYGELGFLPTAVGLVLTDGAGFLSGLEVYDAGGNRRDFGTQAIDLQPNTTADDRFLGVINSAGISRLSFGKTILDASPSDILRLDHLQYGLFVPEPSSLALLLTACAVGGAVAQLRVAYRRNQRTQERIYNEC